ncbi:unnamed protein product [Fraxinus pennsylvanica]|uniref:GRAM domain-containing protein n=1 Tax=Fraxinus pennsylvanica TaxID=56036 RepID=A0AAD1ZEP1_9LAMI|nr:unnamed protein product [Fraxinus pennsylvanica]
MFCFIIIPAVKLGPKLTETLKGKLRLGARILRVGGLEKIFKLNFNVSNGEKHITASQCYLSTTAGPIAGHLLKSTDKIAFYSERSIKLSSPTRKLLKIHYKVMIPARRIKRAKESENAKKPRQKYVQIVTDDKFEFWFMGFLNHQKAFKYLQQATSQTPSIKHRKEHSKRKGCFFLVWINMEKVIGEAFPGTLW